MGDWLLSELPQDTHRGLSQRGLSQCGGDEGHKHGRIGQARLTGEGDQSWPCRRHIRMDKCSGRALGGGRKRDRFSNRRWRAAVSLLGLVSRREDTGQIAVRYLARLDRKPAEAEQDIDRTQGRSSAMPAASSRGHLGVELSEQPMTQPDAWRMIRRRAAVAGMHTPIGNHSFRATAITAYLANGGALEHAQEMAAHESPRTTKLYDRTKERLTQDEVERIRL